MNRDPIGFGGGATQYPYVGNRTLVRLDRAGLAPLPMPPYYPYLWRLPCWMVSLALSIWGGPGLWPRLLVGVSGIAVGEAVSPDWPAYYWATKTDIAAGEWDSAPRAGAERPDWPQTGLADPTFPEEP